METNFRLNPEQIEKLVQAGVAAPTPANLQAWKVVVREAEIELRLDPSRVTPFLDSNKCAAVVGLGTFAENVSLSAQAMGLRFEFSVKEDGDQGAIATFRFQGAATGGTNDDLHRFIFDRCTNRKFGNGNRIGDDVLEKLKKELEGVGIAIQFSAVASGSKRELFETVLGKGDAIRFFNSNTRDEMFSEICWSDEDALTRDRLTIDTLEVPKPVVGFMRLVKRFPTILKLVPQSAMEKTFLPQLQSSSHLCCLSVPGPYDPVSAFKVGRALERLWLRATSLGVSIQPWTILPYLIFRNENLSGEGLLESERATLLELKKNLKQACDLNDDMIPIFIFRISKSEPPTARSIRRPWKDFVHYE